MIKIIGISGSLRKDSYNTAILQLAKEFCPPEAVIEIVGIGNLPIFNQDMEKAVPVAVKELKEKIKQADGVLFSTPEYNYSMPGGLKNAIDWISRPYGDNSFDGKPAGIMSASSGTISGARAQHHLRQSMVFLNMYPINQPQFMVPFVQDKFEDGKIKDDKTREKIKEYVEALVQWIKRFRLQRADL
jgi:chromate reductase